MTRRREILVGVVVVAGILVGVFGTLWLQGMRLARGTVEVQARVAQAGQLMEGNAVKFRGVPIGKVASISVEPGGEAVRLRLLVDRDLALPADAAVLISPESLFGDWQVEIISRSAFPRFEYLDARAPDELPGYSIPDISRLTAVADQIAQNLSVLTDRVELAFTEETALNLKAAIDNLQDLSEGLARLVGQQATTFAGIATEVQEAAGDIGAAAQAARNSFERMDGVFAGGSVDSILADTRDAAENIRVLSGDLGQAAVQFQATMQRADSAFARFDRITAQVEAGDGGLGRLLGDSSLVLRAEGALSQLNLLLEDIRRNPQRYVRLSIF